MCRYNIAIDDALMEEVRPHIGQDTAVQSWLEELLHNALLSYAAQFEESNVSDNKKIVEQLKALENDPDGVFKLGSILKPSKYYVPQNKNRRLKLKTNAFCGWEQLRIERGK